MIMTPQEFIYLDFAAAVNLVQPSSPRVNEASARDLFQTAKTFGEAILVKLENSAGTSGAVCNVRER